MRKQGDLHHLNYSLIKMFAHINETLIANVIEIVGEQKFCAK